jgi:hypothetical protein
LEGSRPWNHQLLLLQVGGTQLRNPWCVCLTGTTMSSATPPLRLKVCLLPKPRNPTIPEIQNPEPTAWPDTPAGELLTNWYPRWASAGALTILVPCLFNLG